MSEALAAALVDAAAIIGKALAEERTTRPTDSVAMAAPDPRGEIRKPIDIDWNALKIAVQAKIVNEDRPVEVIGRKIAVPQLGGWLRTRNAHLVPEAFLRVLDWLGASPYDFLFRVEA